MSISRKTVSIVAALVMAPALAHAQAAPDAGSPVAPPPTPDAAPAPSPDPAPSPMPAPSVAAPAPAAAPSPRADEDAALAARLAEAETSVAKPAAAPPARSGLTVDVEIGVAAVNFTPADADDFEPEADPGTVLGGRSIAVGVGGFLSPTVALGFRLSATTSSGLVESLGDSVALTTTTVAIGPSLQFWPLDRLFFAGSFGLGMAFDNLPSTSGERGLAVDARVGTRIAINGTHGLTVAAALTPMFLDDVTVTSYGLQLGWQAF